MYITIAPSRKQLNWEIFNFCTQKNLSLCHMYPKCQCPDGRLPHLIHVQSRNLGNMRALAYDSLVTIGGKWCWRWPSTKGSFVFKEKYRNVPVPLKLIITVTPNIIGNIAIISLYNSSVVTSYDCFLARIFESYQMATNGSTCFNTELVRCANFIAYLLYASLPFMP